MKKKTKYIFVIGGVMSGVGKGVASASIGLILKKCGFKVSAIKIDPYINVDAGTMNPTEHGEVFVTNDGDETDQDLGNYERFLDIEILSDNYMTTGRVYQTVIEKERNLEYGGKCVQVVPHIPLEIIRRIKLASEKLNVDIMVIEIGGSVGEYENILFLEAARMMKIKSPEDILFIMVSFLPTPPKIGEMKTKPTQHAARALNSTGIQPDFIICRSAKPIDQKRRQKIATFCNINPDDAIAAPDVDSIYEVPLNFEKDKLAEKILDKFKLKRKTPQIAEWKRLNRKIKNLKKEIKIAVVGKYFGTGDYTLSDSYISVIESIKHASWFNNVKPVLNWVDSEEFEKSSKKIKKLKKFDGIIVPGGFGSRGIEGVISAIKFAREQKIPYLGLCYGMQLAVVEFARHVAGIKNANTMEIDQQGKNLVINVMNEQKRHLLEKKYGGTMRLGSYPCVLKDRTISRKAYGKRLINERHRHRYEFNNDYRDRLQKKGLIIAGTSPNKKLVEIIELNKKTHPFFVGVQFHPEFKSRPLNPHPLFREFIKVCNRKAAPKAFRVACKR
jgi:CTP synthase